MNFGKFKKRVLTFLLAFAIMLSFVPAGLAAAENSPVDENDTNLEYLRDLIDAATETIVQASADLVIDGYRYPVSIELPLGVSTTATGVTPIAHAAASGNIHWYVNQWWMQNAQHSPIPTRPQINAANFLVVEYPTPPAAGTQLVLSLSATGGWNHTHAQAMALPAEHRVVVVADGETTQFVFDLRAPFTKAVQTGANAFNPNATEFGMTVNTQGAAHGPATRAYFANNRVEDDGGGNGNGGDIEYSDHALRPFPQAGLGTGVVVDLYTPTGLTQEDMNHAVLRQFARIIQGAPQSIAPGVAAHPAVYFFEEITSQFVVDPASVRDDPDNFRMAMFIAHGTGGWGTGARSLRLTVCEAMGYGMLMLVKMSGSEDIPFEFNGSTTTIRNLLFNALPTELQDHFCIGEVDTKLFFDAMFRSLRHWPTHPIHVTGGHHQTGAVVTNNSYRGNVPNNFRPAYTMAWSLHYNTDIQGFIRETGPSNATDGAMDMAYAIILAGEQWGDDPVWCPTTPDGKVYSYSEWARRMVNDLWLMNVHRSFGQSGGGTGVNATAPARTGGGNYHITIGNWVNNNQGANSRTSRPSDHILHHLKAFLEVNPQNDWQRVIDVTYESLNAVAAMQAEPNGIIPDFIRWDNVNDVWIVPNQGTGTHPNHTAGQQWHESSSDGARHWNACRVPWRLGVDVLFSGVTPVSETVTETYNAFQLAVTNGVFNQVAGRWLNGELNLTHEWGRNSYNAFWGPSAVLAFAHGPQAWADSAWNVVSNNTFMNNQFGDYISMLTSIAITGNEWTPVGSPLTVINGTGSAPRYVAGARVPIEANDGFLPFSHWVLDGAEFWEGSDQYDSRAYIVMP
ncbi:MAG: hypothetical protein FWD05_10400, partial [Oscillospiraceae bacterium]|nr:hypothetical protein [Oscillospiraceae bacterium]